MYKLPNQFDATTARLPDSAAGGGSTSTTCSSCVITMLVVNTIAARQLSSVAAKAAAQPSRANETNSTDDAAANKATMSPMQWGVLGFFLVPLATVIGFVAGGGLTVAGALFSIAAIIGAFCLAYDKLTDNPRRGAIFAILLIVGWAIGSVVEVFLWLGVIGS